MAPQVLALGELVADMIVPIALLPVYPHEHQVARDMLIEAGGSGNFLILAQRLGLRTQVLGVVGEDFFGDQIRAALINEGVDLSSVITPPHSRTTLSIVLVDDDAQHVFVWMRGTGEPQLFDPAWRPIVEQADALFTTGYALHPTSTLTPSAVKACLAIAHERQTPIFFDLGPDAVQTDRADIEAVIGWTTVFLATDEELASWTGISDSSRAARQLLAQGPTMVIVKLGARGCLIVTAEQQTLVEAFPVDVRNTAGAGDAFSAACVYGYFEGLPHQQLGLLANAVGAGSVATIGTGTRLPRRQEIAQLLARYGHTFFKGK
jgi:ribokinase